KLAIDLLLNATGSESSCVKPHGGVTVSEPSDRRRFAGRFDCPQKEICFLCLTGVLVSSNQHADFLKRHPFEGSCLNGPGGNAMKKIGRDWRVRYSRGGWAGRTF